MEDTELLTEEDLDCALAPTQIIPAIKGKVINKVSILTEKISSQIDSKTCEICDKECKNQRGLLVHKSRSHRPKPNIPLLDQQQPFNPFFIIPETPAHTGQPDHKNTANHERGQNINDELAHLSTFDSPDNSPTHEVHTVIEHGKPVEKTNTTPGPSKNDSTLETTRINVPVTSQTYPQADTTNNTRGYRNLIDFSTNHILQDSYANIEAESTHTLTPEHMSPRPAKPTFHQPPQNVQLNKTCQQFSNFSNDYHPLLNNEYNIQSNRNSTPLPPPEQVHLTLPDTPNDNQGLNLPNTPNLKLKEKEYISSINFLEKELIKAKSNTKTSSSDYELQLKKLDDYIQTVTSESEALKKRIHSMSEHLNRQIDNLNAQITETNNQLYESEQRSLSLAQTNIDLQEKMEALYVERIDIKKQLNHEQAKVRGLLKRELEYKKTESNNEELINHRTQEPNELHKEKLHLESKLEAQIYENQELRENLKQVSVLLNEEKAKFIELKQTMLTNINSDNHAIPTEYEDKITMKQTQFSQLKLDNERNKEALAHTLEKLKKKNEHLRIVEEKLTLSRIQETQLSKNLLSKKQDYLSSTKREIQNNNLIETLHDQIRALSSELEIEKDHSLTKQELLESEIKKNKLLLSKLDKTESMLKDSFLKEILEKPDQRNENNKRPIKQDSLGSYRPPKEPKKKQTNGTSTNLTNQQLLTPPTRKYTPEDIDSDAESDHDCEEQVVNHYAASNNSLNFQGNYGYNSPFLPFPGYNISPLVDNVKCLQAHELYREDIQGALALSKWLGSIEFSCRSDEERKLVATKRIDYEIVERLGGTIHNLTWEQLKQRLYTFVTPSTFDIALTKLYQMEFFGEEHPATFYSMLCGYLRTMVAAFRNEELPEITGILDNCLLIGLKRPSRLALKGYLKGLNLPKDLRVALSNQTSIDKLNEFLKKFTKMFNENPKDRLFREKPDRLNVIHYHQPQEPDWYPNTLQNYQQQPYFNNPHNTPNRTNRIPYTDHRPLNNQRFFQNQQLPQFETQYPPPQMPFRDETCNTNKTQGTKPWLLWKPWTCTQPNCGEENRGNRGTCFKCKTKSHNQPDDSKLCDCGKRVYIYSRTCPFCKSSIPIPSPQTTNTTPS